jgi:dTDP-glucose pyrophosphorylase
LKNWTEILLKPSDTLESAIHVLQDGQARIALVVDQDNKLLGTVTDGDVRRTLINHVGMDYSVKEIMNTSPTTAFITDPPELILSVMKSKGLLSIPLLNKQGTLVGLETIQHLIENKQHDNPVFLMAGGFGTRLHPLTIKTPKPLLNVGNRPLLETIIIQFVEAGFSNFYISTHYKSEMIRNHFGNGANWGVNIEYVYEDSPLGTAGSLGLLPKNIQKSPIIMMNGDILTKVNFEDLLNFHQEQEGLATVCIREYEFQIPYGVVDVLDHKVNEIVEKPVQKYFVSAGIYVLDHKIINSVDGLTYCDMPNLIQDLIKKGEQVNVFPVHEYWLDIGRMEEYEQAHESYEIEF